MAWLLFCLGLEELVGKKLRIMWGWERSKGQMMQAVCILFGVQEW